MAKGDSTTEAILEAALTTFGAKGFRATSLSQVAAVAKVSRPTLYARYPDKTKLFRAVIERGYADALAAVSEAATSPGNFEDVLCRVLWGYYGTLFERFHGLPQVDELILVQSEEAEDLVLEAREEFRKRLEGMIRRQMRIGAIDSARIGIPVAQLVDLIRLAPHSFKTPSTSRTRYRRDLKNLARLAAGALTRE